MPNRRIWTGIIMSLAAALAIGIGSAPASAVAQQPDPSAQAKGGTGVHYAPEAFRKLAKKPQFVMVDLRNPNDVTAFTSKSDFDRAVAAAEASLVGQVGVTAAGQWADMYSDDELGGYSRRIDSGWAVNDLRAVGRCNFWGCAGDWNDVISSVFINGSATFYTDAGYAGIWFWIGGWGWVNMSTYGVDNMFSSVNVWW